MRNYVYYSVRIVRKGCMCENSIISSVNLCDDTWTEHPGENSICSPRPKYDFKVFLKRAVFDKSLVQHILSIFLWWGGVFDQPLVKPHHTAPSAT